VDDRVVALAVLLIEGGQRRRTSGWEQVDALLTARAVVTTSDSRSTAGPRQMQMPNLLDGLSDVAGGRGQGYGGLAAQ